jgi:hypothetical protein
MSPPEVAVKVRYTDICAVFDAVGLNIAFLIFVEEILDDN